MIIEVAEKSIRAPAWLGKRIANAVASIPRISDAAVPRFPAIPNEFLKASGYSSQLGQDWLVDQIFFRGYSGTFVDVGAHDGMNLSNTYFLEQVRGWKGLCVEPNPRTFATLATNRSCLLAETAIGSEEGFVDFTEITGPDMLSGISGNLNFRHKVRIRRELKNTAGEQRKIRVKVVRLQSLLDEHSINDIDLLTIDTEGSELAVLKGIDFMKTRISMILIERNYEGGRIPRFLKQKGFIRTMAIGWDDVYLRDDLKIHEP